MTSNYFKKKGSADVIFVILGIMVLALLVPIYNLVMGEVGTALSNSTNVTEAQDTTNMLTEGWRNNADIMFVTIFFALYIGAIILSYFLDTHPLFIVGGIIVMIIMVWIAMLFANSYVEITAPGTALGDEMTNLPMTAFIMQWFGEISIGLVVIVLIVLYRKNT